LLVTASKLAIKDFIRLGGFKITFKLVDSIDRS
jgi:hypothetical protein